MKMFKVLLVNFLSVVLITTSFSVSVQAAGIPNLSSGSSSNAGGKMMDPVLKVIDEIVFVKGRYIAGVGMIGGSFFFLGSLGMFAVIFLGGVGVLMSTVLTKDACKEMKCNKGIFDY